MESRTMVYSGSYRETTIRRGYMTGVFGWMAIALIITGLVVTWMSRTTSIINLMLNNKALFIILFVLEIVIVTGITFFLNRLSITGAVLLFVGYAFLNGITFSALFYIFTFRSVAQAFYITAGTFGLMSIYGYVTRSDLSRWGNRVGVLLIGLLIATSVNFFMQSSLFDWMISYAGILIFMALTTYDVQKIRVFSERASIDRQPWPKSAVFGALLLYLDFINLFLFFLRIFGARR